MNTLALAKELIKNDRFYFQTFSRLIEWDDCVLFHNPIIPLRYDANKAMFLNSNQQDLPGLLDRIAEFYFKVNLIPRLEINPFSLPPNPEKILEAKNWECLKDIEYSVLLLEKLDFIGYQPINNSFINKVSYETLSSLLQIRSASLEKDEPRDIYLKSILFEFLSGQVDYYILTLDNIPTSKGCIFKNGSIARIENISTIPGMRRKGAGKALVTSLLDLLLKDPEIKYIFLFTETGSIAEILYKKLGFQTIYTGHFKIYIKGN